MSSVIAIARNTFREAVRNRILYVILFFSLIMIGFSGAISQLSISDHERIFHFVPGKIYAKQDFVPLPSGPLQVPATIDPGFPVVRFNKNAVWKTSGTWR